MIFRQLCSDRGGHLAYVLGDPITREAIILDMLPDHLSGVTAFLSDRGLAARYLLQTHDDPRHIDALALLRQRHATRLIAHEQSPHSAVDIRVQDHDTLYFGEERLTLLHLPGLDSHALACLWNDRLFTGEILVAQGLTRRLAGGLRAEVESSIQQRLAGLPDETLIYPALESRGRRLSSLEEQRRTRSADKTGGGQAGLLGRCARLLSDNLNPDQAAPTHQDQGVEHSLYRYVPGAIVPAFS